jgi:glycosyltransferase involved in cell wall biosynthesis
MNDLRVGLVVQRYGVEVQGGAETLARRIAELISGDVELTVLTTCAAGYVTWADHYPPGEADVNGVRTIRFRVPTPRDAATFDRLSARAYAAPEDGRLGAAWVKAQGPHAPELLDHLRTHRESYDVVVFVTYLYGTTIEGLPIVSDRSILVRTVHDEPPLRLRVFDRVFELPTLLIFSTPEENAVASKRFGVPPERVRIIGGGADEPPHGDPARFRSARAVDRPYAISIGRLDASKGVGELIDHHAAYRAAHPDGVDLVLVGEGPLEPPAHSWLHSVGYVDDQMKHDAITGANVVVLPSPYESLSLAQLEAWSHACPSLANSASPVLVGQSRRSNGGLWYSDRDEYRTMLDFLVASPAVADALGRQGRRYVQRAHNWDVVRSEWLNALHDVAETVPSRARATRE